MDDRYSFLVSNFPLNKRSDLGQTDRNTYYKVISIDNEPLSSFEIIKATTTLEINRKHSSNFHNVNFKNMWKF